MCWVRKEGKEVERKRGGREDAERRCLLEMVIIKSEGVDKGLAQGVGSGEKGRGRKSVPEDRVF